MKSQTVILYGAGYYGGEYLIDLARENIHVEAYCDQSAKKITRHFGCDVYTLEEAKQKYSDLPFVVTIKNERVNQEVCEILRKNGLEFYPNFAAYYQGLNDKDVKTVKCGEAAPYQVCQELLEEKGIVFSFGIGYDHSFEQELCTRYGMEVYAFDPSPEAVDRMKSDTTPNLHYFPYGIADEDGIKKWHRPRSNTDYSEYFTFWTSDSKEIEVQVYCLESLMKKLGHEHINLLKMDVEGTEFKVLPSIIGHLDIDQICIETHARIFPNSVSIMREVKELFNTNGYLLISNQREEQTYIKAKLVNN